jgi:hypothetical protein
MAGKTRRGSGEGAQEARWRKTDREKKRPKTERKREGRDR